MKRKCSQWRNDAAMRETQESVEGIAGAETVEVKRFANGKIMDAYY